MKYKDPKKVCSPKDAVSDLDVIYDGGDSSVSVAKLKWYGDQKTGIRWNVGMREWNDPSKKAGKECVGVPSSRGYPTWFVIPDELLDKNSDLWKLIDKHEE